MARVNGSRSAKCATRPSAVSWIGRRPELDGWKPPTEVPPGMRFGAFDVDLDQFPNGVAASIRGSNRCRPTSSCRPSCRFPFRARCLIKAADSGKDEAITLAAVADAALPDLRAAGQGPLHHRRPGRPGREFRRVHAPGRLSRAPGHQPHLDRGAAHRAAADRSHRAHGERDPEVPAQRVRDDRGIQHDGRRGRRAVPDPGRRQLPDQFQRRRAAAADQHRQQRCAVRRLCPGDATIRSSACRRASSSRSSRTPAST